MLWLLLWACTSPAPPAAESGGVEEIGGAGDVSEALYSGDQIPHLALELSEEALSALQRQPTEYVEGALIYEEARYEPVGVRLKGQGSFQPITHKPSFKIDFDTFLDGGRFLGLERLTLNNMSNDPSMLHERLAYAVYREAGVPAPRCAHATVSVNGEPYGLYANVEAVDELMAERWYSDMDGSMFEGWDVDFYDRYIDDYQLEFGPDDRSALQAIADALESPGEAGIEAARPHTELEEFLRYWAVGVVVGQFDGYPYSAPGDDVHIYVDSEGVASFLPWGVDETFTEAVRADQVNGILARRCLEAPSCAAEWEAAVAGALDLADQIDLLGLFDAVSAQIAPSVEADDRKSYSDQTVWRQQEQVRSYIQDRRSTLEQQLDR